MNNDQLNCIRTCDLLSLRERISSVLFLRRKADRRKIRLAKIESIQPVKMSKDDVFVENSSNLFSLPGHYARKHTSNTKYLHALIEQDWSHIYRDMGGSETYYVYVHADPHKPSFVSSEPCGGNYGGRPFYIGKGSGDRAFDLKRNQGHGKMIKNLTKEGYKKDDIVKILFNNLTESKSLEIESKLIYFFGTIYAGSTKKNGLLLNIDVPPVPDFIGTMVKFDERPPKRRRRKHKSC